MYIHIYKLSLTNQTKTPRHSTSPQVFLQTRYSFALVNLKPLLPGHVLVCPRTPHKRLTDLGPDEVTDLFTTVQRVQHMLARHYFAPRASSSLDAGGDSGDSSETEQQSQRQRQQEWERERGSFNIALQDGPEAGQTVAHVHVHVIPRIKGVTGKTTTNGEEGDEGDVLYERMAGEEGNVGGALWDRQQEDQTKRPVPGGEFARIEDSARQARSMEEMEEEAALFRSVLEAMDKEKAGGSAAAAS